MATKRHSDKATGEGETMSARDILQEKIEVLTDDNILRILQVFNILMLEASNPEVRRIVYSMLKVWERRHGGKSVDALTDILDVVQRGHVKTFPLMYITADKEFVAARIEPSVIEKI